MKKVFIVLVVAMFLLGSTVSIADASGACCFTGGECAEATTEQNCTNSGGVRWAGNGTTCDDDPNPCRGTQSASEAVTVESLGVENVGILPTNPFYFVKNLGRAIRQALTFNPVKKAERALKDANQRAAEIKKLEEVAPENLEAITAATGNYQRNAERLQERLESLKETSENPNVDKLLDQLADRGLKHQQLFDELKAKLANSEFTAKADRAQEAVSDAVAVAPEKLESAGQFRQRIEKVVAGQKGELRELKAAEAMDRLEEKLIEKTDEKLAKLEEKSEKAAPEEMAQLKEELGKLREENLNLRNEMAALKENLLLKFGGRLEAGKISGGEAAVAAPAASLENLPGNAARRVKILDDVRERVSSSEVKSQLNVVRQEVLRKAEEEMTIGLEEAKKMISEAEWLVKEVQEQISVREGDVSNAAWQLLKRAEFHLSQARDAYNAEKYGNAFGQATAAISTAKNALRPLTATAEDYSRDLGALRNYYDSLVKRIQEAGLSREKYSKSFEILTEVEKQLVEIAKMIDTKVDSAKIVEAIRNVKLLLSTVEQLFQGLLGPIAPVAVPSAVPAVVAPVRPQSERCEVIQKEMRNLKSRLASGELTEAQYKEKLENLQKEYEKACAQPAQSLVAPKVAPQAPSSIKPGIVCAQEYEPVCGINGKTYPNECHANAGGVKVQYKGECKEGASAGGAPAPAPAAPSAVAPVESFFDVFVTIDENGQFSPQVVKVKKGSKVTWVNKSQQSVWPASAIHPTHTVYPEPGGCIGSKFDACRELKPGEMFIFVFNQVGGWKYHDHLNPASTGAVEVVE